MTAPLPLVRAADLPPPSSPQGWLVRDVWLHGGVGFIAGERCGKTLLAVDLAVSVASGTDFLGRFPVFAPGPVVAIFANDPSHTIRERIACLADARHLDLAALDVHLPGLPALRLDTSDDQARLAVTLAGLKPRLLILDPLSALHDLNESCRTRIGPLLAWLRKLSREHQLAVVAVHGLTKKGALLGGCTLRGSGELAIWADCLALLAPRPGRDSEVLLTLGHRSAPPRSPLPLARTQPKGQSQPYLRPLLDPRGPATPAPLADRVIDTLRQTAAPISRAELRERLRVNNLNLGNTLTALRLQGHLHHSKAGWHLAPGTSAATSLIEPATSVPTAPTSAETP